MRFAQLSLPLIVILSLVFLSACSEPSNIDFSQSRESRSGMSGSGKYMSGSTSNTRRNRDRSSVTGSSTPLIPVLAKTVVSTGISTIPRTQTQSNPVSNPSQVTEATKNISYSTDHGKEQISIQFNISYSSEGIVTALKATMINGDHESKQYIARFNSDARNKILGKKISTLVLSAVGGASDTTDAFSQVIASL